MEKNNTSIDLDFEIKQLKEKLQLQELEIKSLQSQHAAAKQRLQLFVEKNLQPLLLVDEDGIIQLANTMSKDLFGRKHLKGIPLFPLFNSSEHKTLYQFTRSFKANNKINSIVLLSYLDQYLRLDMVNITLPNELEQHFLLILTDVTLLNYWEIEQREQDDWLSITLSSIADAVIAMDSEGFIKLTNHATNKLFNILAPTKAVHFDELFHLTTTDNIKVDLSFLLHQILGNKPSSENISVLLPHHPNKYFELKVDATLTTEGKLRGIFVIISDVTFNKIQQEKLFRTEQDKLISLMAAGVAHDFNNMLSSIMASASMLKLNFPADNEERYLFDYIETGVEQAKKLTDQLLSLTRHMKLEKQLISIVESLKDAINLTTRGAKVEVISHFPEKPIYVSGNQGNLVQVFSNLLINAIQSSDLPCQITITVTIIESDSVDATPSNAVQIKIIDQGCGIPTDEQKRVFNPYHSTNSRGRGLGLFLSRSIIEQHDGKIILETSSSSGSCFCITLPTTEPMEEKIQTSQTESKDTLRILTQYRPILVMDDEPAIRKLLSQMLKRLECQVLLASNSDEALTLFQQAVRKENPPCLAILDLTLPKGLDGVETLKELRRHNPSLPAIASSGYSHKPVRKGPEDFGFDEFLAKPYSIKDLETVLIKVLAK